MQNFRAKPEIPMAGAAEPDTSEAACFVRRFVVPLHRASLDFDPDSSLRDGRAGLAADGSVPVPMCTRTHH